MRPIIILLCVVIFHCSVQNVGAAAARSNRIWPISGNTSVDLPQSSPFAPRLQISQGSKYDYHRGVDIPADLYSKVYAVSDGTVRINGSHHGYSDGVVQLHHTDWEEGGDFYTNYIHIVMSDGQNPISLTNGQSVGKGQHIAYSNGTPSLDHIHFEVRVGSYRKEYACNPWKYLPNSDNDYSSFEAELSLTPNYNSIDCQAVVNVSVLPNQLTFNRVELHILDSSDTPQKVRFYDMCGTNVNYTQGQVDNSTYQDDPDDYSSSYLIHISPMFFNSESYEKNERAGWGFEFVDLPLLSGGGRVMAKIFDVFGNSHSNGYFNYTCSDGGNTSSTTATSSTTPTEESSCSGCTRNDRIWPISGTTTVDPQAIPYGSRRQYSGSYKFHRGVDIRCSTYTNVYAVADGTVRINGSHSGYTSGNIVQLKHENWEENPNGDVYTNYMYIMLSKSGGEDPITLTIGQAVKKGDLIAYSYETSFPHIHFEVRDGGTASKYSSNPWKYMPNGANDYTSFDTASVSLTTNYNDVECQAVVNVSVPPNLLTFNRVELHILDSSDTPQKVRFYDMHGTNTNRTTSQINDQNYREDPNDASSYLIRISPKTFFYNPDTNLPTSAEYGFEFVDLPSLAGGGRVMAKIFDVFGNSIQTDYTSSEGTATAPTTTATEESSCSGCTRNDRIWPISGTTTVDLPQSVPYGSRRYSSSGSYNFHRGVDIRCSTYTNVYAVADGTVRINGSHSGYSSSIVQLKHAGWEENPGGYVYTNYQQISLVKSGGEDPITLPLGHNVEKGDLIAYSYRESNFVYIHFEVRAGGTASKYSSNPWKYMPNGANDYTSFDTASVSLTTNYNDVECQAVVNVSVPPNLLTFNRVELHILDSSDTPQKVRFYDMCGTNTNRTTSQINDQNYREDPNDASSYLIRISPKTFSSTYLENNKPAEYGFEFVDLPSLSGGGRVMAKIFDVFGKSRSTDYESYTCSY